MSTLQSDQAKAFHHQKVMLRRIGYSDNAIDLIQQRPNLREMEHPTLCVTSESECGDTLILYALVRNGYFEEVTFQYIGCVGLLSSAAALTILMQGKSVTSTYRLNEHDIIHFLGYVPDSKYECVEFAISALKNLLETCENYLRQPG